MGLPYRDEQCPKRGPGLSHSQDGSINCAHCGQMVAARFGWSAEPVFFEEGFDHRGPVGKEDGKGRGTLTKMQEAELEFLSWLWWRGELD